MLILGISAYYHDSAACIVRDGRIVAAAQEERFTRRKHDASFPRHAIRFCLEAAGARLADVASVVFYEKPILKFERLLETYLGFAPRGFGSFVAAMPVWLREKLYMKDGLRRSLEEEFDAPAPPLLFTEHHQAHAASAYYPSPFAKAAVLTLDGVGEWATTTAWTGEDSRLTPLWEIRFPHSLGLLYSAVTYHTGFRVNNGEYKVMGLAPYGRPRYVQELLDHVIDVKPDGSFRLNMEYFDYCTGLRMTSDAWDRLFGGPARSPESDLTQREMDLARSVQDVVEEVVVRLGRTLHRQTGEAALCMAGGVALNCVANGRLQREGPFHDIWIQPAAGDAGGAVGAALAAWHEHHGTGREPPAGDGMGGALLGPAFSDAVASAFLDSVGAVYREVDDDALYDLVAEALAAGRVVGWFQGRMEFGPRALGNRSILGDPRSPRMQSLVNLKIKFRESFRPFAPSVPRDRVADYFELDADSPYMLLVSHVRADRRVATGKAADGLWGIELLNLPRSDIPAVTHVDHSARVQTVHADINPRYHRLLRAFEARTGCAVLLNTSFNVRGEPIVCTPEDAYRCFMRTEMDMLVLGSLILHKADQPAGDRETEDDAAMALES